MAAAAVTCTPAPITFARLPATSHDQFPHTHPPTRSTLDTRPRHTLPPSTLRRPHGSLDPRTHTLQSGSLDMHDVEVRGGRSGEGGIVETPDGDTGEFWAVMDEDREDVRKERRAFGSVSRTGDVSDWSEYSDEDVSERGSSDEHQDDILATFSDPGHYAYTDRPPLASFNPTPVLGGADSDNLVPPPPLPSQNTRPSAPSPLSARECPASRKASFLSFAPCSLCVICYASFQLSTFKHTTFLPSRNRDPVPSEHCAMPYSARDPCSNIVPPRFLLTFLDTISCP